MLHKGGLILLAGLLAQSVVADGTTTTSSSAAAASSCNPLESSDCASDKALAGSFTEDFTSESKWFSSMGNPGNITYGSDGVSLTLAKRYDNPALASNFYIMFGKVEVELQAAPGQGVVSSFFLQSDDLDEIDLEWVGSDNTQYQSNFFSKGDTTTYDRGAFHSVDSPVDTFHNYTLDWAMDKTVWYLDGAVSRTLLNSSAEGYPQSPMALKMGIWAGGDPSNAAGTIEWAGGEIDYTKAPFSMYVKRVVVTDYSTGSEYSYNGQSGTWESIEAKDGSVYGRYDQAQADFAVLADGGEISSTVASSSTTSASSTSSSTSTSSISSSASSSSSSISSSSSSSSTPSSTVSSSTSSSTISSSTSSESATISSTTEVTSSTDSATPEAESSELATSTVTSQNNSDGSESSSSSATIAYSTPSSTLTSKVSTSEQQSSSSATFLANENKGSTFSLTHRCFSFLAIIGAGIAF